MSQPIKLQGTSRRHNPKNYNIELATFSIKGKDLSELSISNRDAYKFLSWLCGWNYIGIKNFPKITRSDVLSEVQSFIDTNACAILEGESSDPNMTNLIKEMLKTFASTLHSLEDLKLDQNVNPKNERILDVMIPCESLFKLAKLRAYARPSTDEMLTRELNYFKQHHHFNSKYSGLITKSYYKMRYLGEKESEVNGDCWLKQIFEDAKIDAYENRKDMYTADEYIAHLKADILDYIDAFELAIETRDDAKFNIIRFNLFKNMPDNYLLYLCLLHFETLKSASCINNFHELLNGIFTEPAIFLEVLMNNTEEELYANYENFVTKPYQLMGEYVNKIHIQLVKYLNLTPPEIKIDDQGNTHVKENDLGVAYGMVDLISGHLLQILLYLMSGISGEYASRLCIHTLGCIVVDLFYQRIVTEVWDNPNTTDIHIRNVIWELNQIQIKHKVYTKSALTMAFQQDIKRLAEQHGNGYYSFLLTLRFPFKERLDYNLQEFARKINAERTSHEKINEATFGNNILSLLHEVTQPASMNENMCLYSKKILQAVFNANGFSEFMKAYNNGTVYAEALKCLVSDGSE